MHPVLVLPLNEGSGDIVYDRSGYNNHGTCYNTQWIKKWRDWLLYFNGENAYVNRPTVSGLNRSALTFAFWSKQLGTKDFFMHPLGLFGGHRATIYVAPNTFRYCYKFESIDGVKYEGVITTLDSEWHFIAVTFNGEQIKCYIDGVLEKTIDAVGSITGGDESLFIGNTGTGSSPARNWFYGFIADVLVLRKVLSDEQIAFLSSLFRGEKRSPPVF